LPGLAPEPGGLLSVALSVAFPRLDVIQHPALWCPDFPPASLPAVIRYPGVNIEIFYDEGSFCGEFVVVLVQPVEKKTFV